MLFGGTTRSPFEIATIELDGGMEADIEKRGVEPSVGTDAAETRKRAAASAASVFDEHVELVLVMGPDAVLRHASPGWTRILGESDAPTLGRPVPEALQVGLLASADWETFQPAFALALENGSGVLIPLAFQDPDRAPTRLEGRLYRPRDGTDNVVIVFHDVTSRWTETLELVESERRFRMIAEATDDMVTETDSRGRFQYVSPACTRVLGYAPEELVGRSPLTINHDDEREAFRREVVAHQEPGEPFSVEPHRLRHKDGSWIWVEATGIRYRRADGELRVVGVARDITARLRAESIRQQLEEQLRSSQKLESLGVLAGGIAHDFNNYLTPIVGAANLLSVELPEDSPLRSGVELIRKAAKRATDLTAQMLAYAGGTELRLAALDVSETIREMRLLLESTATRRAELVYDLDRELPLVTADDGQIGQVIMNLVTNAAEALGDGGGCIEIRTGQLEADRDLLREYHFGEQRSPGVYVFVEVRDDGVGIDKETRDHIFDPFFSTKFTGRGLGLSVVLGIVKVHRGALRIDSSPAGGTRFRILLPVASATLRDTIDDDIDVQRKGAKGTQPGTFLVIDDDEGAREITSILLVRGGFEVIAEADGALAIEIFRKHAAKISGIVLDSTMPGLSGTQVFEAIRKIDPDVPVILASGYSRECVPESLLASGDTRFLQKPFDEDQLLGVVRQLLGAR